MTGQLKRELGLGGAIVTGLGSILGTGAFVTIGVAAGMWGDAILLAIPLAALVAIFNGLSSAFLAGRFPVAGGTYEYGYRTLNPWFGFSAGWLFLLAKTASAATAALGIGLYIGIDNEWLPVLVVVAATGLVASGLRRTTLLNVVLVTVTIAAIVSFAIWPVSGGIFLYGPDPGQFPILPATAFLFVAYTGYGRIATLGEEVKDPARTIPRAVIVTLAVAAVLYMLIALGGRSASDEFWGLAFLTEDGINQFFRVGAVTAMAGVLINLILGLSRVWLAMGRRRDMPSALSSLNSESQPVNAIIISGLAVASVALLGGISTAWSFSAMTVLLYYGVTNLSALKVDQTRVSSWLGLGSCVFLSFFVPLNIWLIGIGLLAAGLLWKTVFTVGE